MVNLICASIVFCIASTIRIFWVISSTLIWGFDKFCVSIYWIVQWQTHSILLSFYRHGLLCCYEGIPFSREQTRRQLSGQFSESKWMNMVRVFTMMNSFPERMGDGQLTCEEKHWKTNRAEPKVKVLGTLIMSSSLMELMDLFSCVLISKRPFWYCSAHWSPWIRQWPTKSLYNKVGGKKKRSVVYFYRLLVFSLGKSSTFSSLTDIWSFQTRDPFSWPEKTLAV